MNNVSAFGQNGGLSAYELERLENIKKNQEFLSSLNILQVYTVLVAYISCIVELHSHLLKLHFHFIARFLKN